jgi:hypothetical protein
MKPTQIILIAIILVAVSVHAIGQGSPKAVMFDEFGSLTCEDVIARQDYLFAQLESDPAAIGYAMIFADTNHLRQGRQTEAVLNGHTEFRRFDDSRFRILRAVGSSSLKVQFWIVPAGAEVPQHTSLDWDFQISENSKPLKINASTDDEGPCPIGSQFRLFYDRLKTNPHTRAHVVVWAQTRAQFLKEKERVDRDLISKYGISSTRVRYFFIPHRSAAVKWEYWIVPRRNK